MDLITCRELRLEDALGWAALHRTHFPPLSDEAGLRWAGRDDVTAAIALRAGEVVGAVPFHIRDFQINPQVSIKGAFEHAVLVHESLRDQGIGTRMMDAAKQFLLAQADAMMVYRGGEQSAGYRFYTKTGHHDLSYLRPFWLQEPKAQPTTKVKRVSYRELMDNEPEFLAVFRSAYGRYGGFRRRGPGYWKEAFSSAYFDMIPQELVLLRLDDGQPLQGYALLSRELGPNRVHECAHLLELATLRGDPALARPLLAEAMTVAAEWGVSFRAFSTDHAPYVRLLAELGFRPLSRGESSMMIMAYVLDPARLGPKVWQEHAEAEGLEVTVWTPQREAVIHPAASTPARPVLLEMKEDLLTRLLLSRLDLVTAVQQELVTVIGGDDHDVAAIAKALPLAPWAYQHVDYI